MEESLLMKDYNDITLAFSGILQALSLISELAQHGNCNQKALEASLNSVTYIDSPDVITIFGGQNNLQLGLVELNKLLTRAQQRPSYLNYLMGVFRLEKLLMKSPELQKQLQDLINEMADDAQTGVTNYYSLASIYRQTLGELTFKIILTGNQLYLKDQDIVAKIRALLLAAVRSAVLWRQLGGNKLQLFFARKKLIKTTTKAINVEN